jgi:hypothetical protein
MIAVGPMWATLSASYMTDMPAFALAMVCLALGARAVRVDEVNVGLLCAALLVGFSAFTVREFAIVAPLAVCLAALWAAGKTRPGRRVFMIAAFGVLILMACVFIWWRQGLSALGTETPQFPSLSSIKPALHSSAQSAVLVGLLVSPAVILAEPRRLLKAAWARAPRTSAAVGFLAVLALGGETARHRETAKFLGPGYVMNPNGPAGIGPDLFPKRLLEALALVGVLAVLFLFFAALPPMLNALTRVCRGQRETPMSPPLSVVTLAAVGYGLSYTLSGVSRGIFFDRYLLPLLPLIAVLVLNADAAHAVATRSLRIASGAALLALAAFGAVYAANAASYSGTEWSVAEHAAKLAGSPQRVDDRKLGYWTAYHAPHFANDLRPYFNAPLPNGCIVLRAETHPSGGSRQLRAARVWGPTGTQVWIVARQRRRC